MLAWVRQRSGDLGGAVEELERAVALNREFGDYPRLMRDQRVLGDLRWWLEEWDAALTHYEEAMRLARAVANPAQRLDVSVGLAGALAKVGRFEQARLLLDEAEEEARVRGFEELRLQMVVCRADLLAAQGRIAEGMPCYREALEGFEELGHQAYVADLELEMAGWHLWRADPGDVEAAGALIASAEGRKREYTGRGFADRLALQRGVLSVAESRLEEGVSRLEEVTARSGESGMRDLAWQGHVAAARGHLARGADFLARRQLRQAEALLDQLSAGFPAEHQTAFWQDVRRNEVRRLLEAVATESEFSSSMLVQQSAGELDQEARALYRVLEFNKRLSAEHDLDRLLEAILDAAIELTGAERGLVLMVAAGKSGALEVRAAREIGAGDDGDPHERFSRSIAESVHLDGEPVVTVDAMGDERFNEFISIHELKLKSVACLPVRCRGQALGVLYLENRLTRGRFGGRDLRVLAAFADQVAIAISQARLIEDARRRQVELEEARQAIQADFDRQSEDLSARKTDLKLTRERLERVRRQLAGEGDYHGVVGNGPAMSQVFSLVERVKDLDVPVVFVGESGTGKDLLARVLHDHGSRRSGSFVALNCGGVPETLVESTLFGHIKGAFSGASADRQGILEAANKGTLYLDEIGDMSPRMQVDLLRVLQERTYTPLGAAQPVAVDLRLVASSKVPLPELADSGRLRRDLLYRLEVVTVDLPPLAERGDDILPLARRILDREAAHTGRPPRGLSRAAAAALVAHPWPGNVRELEQAIRRAIIIGEGTGPLEPGDIFVGAAPAASVPGGDDGASGGAEEGDERARLLGALERCRWNRTKAAKELGIPRRTFYRKLDKLGLVKARRPS
jgi:DNA-binding NtrC family response regulator